MAKRKLLTALAICVAVALGLVGAFGYFWLIPPPLLAAPRIVTVEKGESLHNVAIKLQQAGVVRSSLVLLIYADLSETARRVLPGDYLFKGRERVPQVMRRLVEGDFLVVTVTIPEGSTLHEIAEHLGQVGLVCPRAFEQAARDGQVVQALGLEPLGAEGYLFPATYRFSPHATVQDILSAMLARFYQVLTPQREERMFELGLTPCELVTLASIIEREAKIAGERPLIASVFYNRLKLGMPLQSDPTAEYSLGEGDAPAATAVRIPSTFNTYMFTGLPPGPIANPGLSSIEAALYPAHTDYLYFVARGDGSHIFSRSLKEHERAVATLARGAMRAGLKIHAP